MARHQERRDRISVLCGTSATFGREPLGKEQSCTVRYGEFRVAVSLINQQQQSALLAAGKVTRMLTSILPN
jgi:hypothetical protein